VKNISIDRLVIIYWGSMSRYWG